MKSNATDADDISAKILKLFFPQIIKYDTHCVNLCLESGSFSTHNCYAITLKIKVFLDQLAQFTLYQKLYLKKLI